jgi:hypothetical protein
MEGFSGEVGEQLRTVAADIPRPYRQLHVKSLLYAHHGFTMEMYRLMRRAQKGHFP